VTAGPLLNSLQVKKLDSSAQYFPYSRLKHGTPMVLKKRSPISSDLLLLTVCKTRKCCKNWA